MKLLAELGLKPNCEGNKMSPGARKVLETAAAMEWVALARLKPSEAQTDEIGRFLHGFLIYHLGKIPPGRHFLTAPGGDAK